MKTEEGLESEGGIAMVQITEKDIDYGLLVGSMARACQKQLSCFWNESEEELEAVFIVKDNGKLIYDGECLIFRLRKNLQENSPHFLEIWKKCAQNVVSYHSRKSAFNHQRKFWTFSSIGVATFYSVNNKCVPWISDGLIRKLAERAKEQPKDFYSETFEELKEVNSPWFTKLYQTAIEMRASGYVWGSVILILKIFLEGIKPVEPFDDKLIGEIEQYLSPKREQEGA